MADEGNPVDAGWHRRESRSRASACQEDIVIPSTATEEFNRENLVSGLAPKIKLARSRFTT